MRLAALTAGLVAWGRGRASLALLSQPFLHREEVQWALLVLAFAGTLIEG